MKNEKVRFLVYASVTAALYVLLTYLSALFGLASGAVQLRLSEALTILPMFFSASVPGLFAGCMLANILSGCALWDIIFGSLATLLGAVFTRLLRKYPPLAFFSPILFNTLIVPPVVYLVYPSDATLFITYIGVFAGELLSVSVFGTLLYKSLGKTTLFKNGDINA